MTYADVAIASVAICVAVLAAAMVVAMKAAGRRKGK